MNVRPESRSELTKALRRRYLGASKREKTAILDTFCEATRYHRKYAITLLRSEPRRRRLRSRAGRKPRYGPEVMRALVVAAEAHQLDLRQTIGTIPSGVGRGVGTGRRSPPFLGRSSGSDRYVGGNH